MTDTAKIYALDIETDTTTDGLDPQKSAVVAVALSTSNRTRVWLGTEVHILTELSLCLRRLAPGVIVTWNGSAFDLPFLADRSVRAGVPLGLRLSLDADYLPQRSLVRNGGRYRASWGLHSHLDACSAWRVMPGRKNSSCALKAVAKEAGLRPVTVDREAIHLLNRLELEQYVSSDAVITRTLAILKWSSISEHIDPPVLAEDGLLHGFEESRCF